MVSPQEGHIRTGVLSGTSGGHSIGGLRACDTACRDSTETGGSATELSATDAWRRAAVGDATHVRLIRTIASLILESTPGIWTVGSTTFRFRS
jgi:hypothetical protein